ncbi:hypothetical protein EZV73_23835 [Acidaminobacter sp. JC074]|uniref:hypothetical protein n=1 Tax=Acidaminobacter sp. JC074 TaxID=2530199 RepID=UPI001F0D5625|nr:hypothetical protein [Acidaminobacter sp. JC074]MCH4890634.1 hypothetical protein [Acidaminobacter sp. JC074]
MLNTIIHIDSDNSKMKSRKTKEEQMIFGKTVQEVITQTLEERTQVIDKSDLKDDMDHVVFFMAHAPLIDLTWIRANIKQYEDDVIFFKDNVERPVAIYIPGKVLSKSFDIIKGDFVNFADLTEKLQMPYRVECMAGKAVVESKKDLQYVIKRLQLRINEKLTDQGVTILDTHSTYIDFDVKVGMDTVIYPNTILSGNTEIGEACTIGPDSRITDSLIGDETTVKDSTILESQVANNTSVGPYAYIRPNSKVGSHVKVGDFVEVKNAVIGDGTKISHLSYVGDADLGKNINVGCGVVFVNYNGKEKSRSTIGDDAFIGCNSNIVAPVNVEPLSYVAAATTVTKNVPSGALAVGRAKQENKAGWVERRNLIKKKS